MNRERSLRVCLGDRTVGTLAVTPQHLVAFEYDPAWLADGFSASSFFARNPIGFQIELSHTDVTGHAPYMQI